MARLGTDRMSSMIQVCIDARAGDIPEMRDLVAKFTRDAVNVYSRRYPTPTMSMDGIQHFYIAVEKEEWKLDTLCDLIETLTDSRLVIYCNTRTKAEHVHREMTRRDF